VELIANSSHNIYMTIGEQKTREKVGKRVQKLRKQLGYTQEELAEKINISRTHMGHIEQGRKSPSFKILDKLAKTLKVEVSTLFS
jgi:transcriptional regulator with XRE-family HTH domain